MNNSAPTGRIFHEIWYLSFLLKSVEKIQVSPKSVKNNRYFTWRHIHLWFLAELFLEWEIFLRQDIQKLKSRILSYVCWTVHHLDSWIKTDQLDVTCFTVSLFTAQHVSNVSTSIFRSLRLIVDLFHELYYSGSMCVGVTVWFGWGGVVSLCRLKH